MQQLPAILPPPPLPDGSPASPRSQERHDNLVRFQSELEFVQCLSNPLYLRELAEQKYFADQAFINYLKYLEYWREPEYVRFIVYPTCLVYLTLLQTSTFRDRLSDPVFIGELVRIGARHHETWRLEKHLTASVSHDGNQEAMHDGDNGRPEKKDRDDDGGVDGGDTREIGIRGKGGRRRGKGKGVHGSGEGISNPGG